jgi:peptide/nickel transport system permease protein
MLRYALKRVLLAVPTLLGVSVLVFVLIHRAPGDPVQAMFGIHPQTGAAQQVLRHQLGLDRSLPIQYLSWLNGLAHGKLGYSLYAHDSVAHLIWQRIPTTLELTVFSMVLSVVIGVPLGVLMAARKDGLLDNVGRVVSMVAVSMPVFWLGLLLLIVFAVKWPVLPTGGSMSDYGWKAMVLPTVALAASFTAIVMRLTRASLLEVLAQDYVRTAQAKGLSSRRVLFRHGLGNGLIPIVTVVGLQTGILLSGAVLTETIFALPGIGRLMVDAVGARDYPLVMGSVVTVAFFYLVINVAVDLLYGFLDPRIRVR